MEPRRFTLMTRAQQEAVILLRTLAELQQLCPSVHRRDFHILCEAIDKAQEISAQLHGLKQHG